MYLTGPNIKYCLSSHRVCDGADNSGKKLYLRCEGAREHQKEEQNKGETEREEEEMTTHFMLFLGIHALAENAVK